MPRWVTELCLLQYTHSLTQLPALAPGRAQLLVGPHYLLVATLAGAAFLGNLGLCLRSNILGVYYFSPVFAKLRSTAVYATPRLDELRREPVPLLSHLIVVLS